MPLDDTGLSVRLRSMKVADVMTRSPIVVRRNTSLNEVARHFIQDRIGAVPVVDDDGRLLGIVSYVDLLQAAFSEANA
jgi:CBS domain-containing protein